MKSLNTRLLVLSVVALMSIGSYIFLRTVSVPTPASQASGTEIELKETIKDKAISDETATGTDIGLPDVQLLKFVIETGKRFLPAS